MLKATIIGNLTRDVSSKATPSGTAIAEFCVAVNRKGKGKDGVVTEETFFVDCSAFGRQAEICAGFLAKGSQVYVSGDLSAREWTGKDGKARFGLRVKVQDVQFIGRRNRDDAPQQAPAVRAETGVMEEPF